METVNPENLLAIALPKAKKIKLLAQQGYRYAGKGFVFLSEDGDLCYVPKDPDSWGANKAQNALLKEIGMEDLINSFADCEYNPRTEYLLLIGTADEITRYKCKFSNPKMWL